MQGRGKLKFYSAISASIFFFLIAGGTSFGADKLIVKDSGDAVKFNVRTDDPTGMVGIGTATPSAILDISPGTITTNAFKVSAVDANNSFQYKVLGHVGGTSHTQMITDLANGRFTIMAAEAADYAPRLQMVGPQDGATAVRGWMIFDYGSELYDLPSAEFRLRHYGTGGTNDYVTMMQSVGRTAVVFPTTNVKVGIGTATPAYLFTVTNGTATAYSDGTGWYTASSRAMKDNIKDLSANEAMNALDELQPVTYTYKSNPEHMRVGFIAEDVPEIVATEKRDALNSMDITALLAKVVKEQQKMIKELSEKVSGLEKELGAK